MQHLIDNFATTTSKDAFQDNIIKFVKDFISEARKLVDRTKRAIYKEYGHEANEATEELFQVQLHTNDEWGHKNQLWLSKSTSHGVSWLTPRAMDGLSRKLLHAMMTNDYFFAVYGGHSAAGRCQRDESYAHCHAHTFPLLGIIF